MLLTTHFAIWVYKPRVALSAHRAVSKVCPGVLSHSLWEALEPREAAEWCSDVTKIPHGPSTLGFYFSVLYIHLSLCFYLAAKVSHIPSGLCMVGKNMCISVSLHTLFLNL